MQVPQEEPGKLAFAGDGTVIEHAGRLELPAAPVPDAGGDGALWIKGDGITVELAGLLRGAPEATPGDQLAGVGIRITGKHVTLRGAKVAGYRVGIWAEQADGLVLEDCDVSGNFRQRLKSTREKESDEDWLDPHKNDGREWFRNYGAGIFVERASGITVRRSRARRGQNGLVLDRCDKAQIYDNDFSFLSGWGIALWRSSDNVIARNATDFCIRGYVHGVYNRGQDSAGILLFEQCSRNVIAENSATHCGDGFFAFAGQEALGGVPAPTPDFPYGGKGNNLNWIVGNDFSYAAAHGLELTFSFANTIYKNRFVQNSICGIWGGYSQSTRISLNWFEENGQAGYGLERGGINIEHGRDNLIDGNSFRGNECGVHLWWDTDEHLAKLPWVAANGSEAEDNQVLLNYFELDKTAIQLGKTRKTLLKNNSIRDVGQALDASEDSETKQVTSGGNWSFPEPPPHVLAVLVFDPQYGRATGPLGARAHLRGRDKIVVDEWGPVEPPAPK